MDADGNEIKRPLSAYLLYNNHRRPVLKAEHPDLVLTDLSKIIGEEWQKLNDSQKTVSSFSLLISLNVLLIYLLWECLFFVWMIRSGLKRRKSKRLSTIWKHLTRKRQEKPHTKSQQPLHIRLYQLRKPMELRLWSRSRLMTAWVRLPATMKKYRLVSVCISSLF